jgi:RimJ/RimL family protein N-acetyltransferase
VRPEPAGAPQPCVLAGDHVRLEPLGPEHAAALTSEVAGDPDVWRYYPHPYDDRAAVDELVATALAQRAAGERFAFAVVDQSTGQAVGSSSFLDIAPADRRIEIGWTFYARRLWRTAVNTESKLLMLGYAFDVLGYERVALKTHHENLRSQAAIARLGAVHEGVLRHHMLYDDGSWRDSVYFSVLAAEWPATRAKLLDSLSAARPAG